MASRGDGLAMPLLILNMGCEMVYVLEQRLRAQAIMVERARKVLMDIARVLFSPAFIDELFEAEDMCTFSEAKAICERLAHCSIMKLNTVSMQKLYDLVSMGFKYQVLAVNEPRQLLDVTLNHLSTAKALLGLSGPDLQLDSLMIRLTEVHGRLPNCQWWAVRRSLCAFFQDRRTKISPLLHEGLQYSDGGMVITVEGPLPTGAEQPGTLRYFQRRPKAGVTTATADKLANTKVFAAPAGSFPCTIGGNRYAEGMSAGASSSAAAAELASADKEADQQQQLSLAAAMMEPPAGSSAPASASSSSALRSLAILQSTLGASASSSSGSQPESFPLDFDYLGGGGGADAAPSVEVFSAASNHRGALARTVGFDDDFAGSGGQGSKVSGKPESKEGDPEKDPAASSSKDNSEDFLGQGDDLLALMDGL